MSASNMFGLWKLVAYVLYQFVEYKLVAYYVLYQFVEYKLGFWITKSFTVQTKKKIEIMRYTFI